jgi:exonuclease III
MKPIIISNIYNPPRRAAGRTSAIRSLERLLNGAIDREHIIIGDFNLHHAIWGGSINQRIEYEREELIRIMDTHSLTSLLEPGTVTYEEHGHSSTIDLSLATTNLVGRRIRCEVEEELNHDSDHLPIITCLNIRHTQSANQSNATGKL